MTPGEAARAAYYAARWQNEPKLLWSVIPQRERNGWEAAARAALSGDVFAEMLKRERAKAKAEDTGCEYVFVKTTDRKDWSVDVDELPTWACEPGNPDKPGAVHWTDDPPESAGESLKVAVKRIPIPGPSDGREA